MKVLIELDDDMFKDIRESNFDSARAIVRNFQATLTDAIRNGTTESKVGKWIEERDDYGNITGWHCSNCYDKTGFVTTCAWDYCPNCGAEMRGSENENNII